MAKIPRISSSAKKHETLVGLADKLSRIRSPISFMTTEVGSRLIIYAQKYSHFLLKIRPSPYSFACPLRIDWNKSRRKLFCIFNPPIMREHGQHVRIDMTSLRRYEDFIADVEKRLK